MTLLALLLAVFALGWYLEYRHQRTLVTELRAEVTAAWEQNTLLVIENAELRDGIQQLATASQNLLNEIQGHASSLGVIVPPPGGLVA